MYKHLDMFVIGQQLAKKVLSVAMYNHYKRLNSSLLLASTHRPQGENGGSIEQINIQPPIGTRESVGPVHWVDLSLYPSSPLKSHLCA